MVAQLPGGHHSKRADGRERPRFRPAERIFTIAGIADNLSVASARQIEPPHEHVTRIAVAIRWVAITVSPPGVVAVAGVTLRLIVATAARAAAELARVIIAIAVTAIAVSWIVRVVVRPMIMTIAESTLPSRLVPFIITTIAVTITIAVANVVVPVSRVVAPSRVIKHRHLR
jgi:hypothetical protein